MDDSQKQLTPKELHNAVLAVAMKLTRSKDQAYDLTQTVFERIASTRPLPAGASRQETLTHAFGVLKSILSSERASERSRRMHERAAGTEWAAESKGGESAEALSFERANRLSDEQRVSRLTAALRTRLSDHPLELAILDRMHDGVTKPADIAAQLTRSVEEIYEAVKRIRRYTKSIVAAERDTVEEVESWPS